MRKLALLAFCAGLGSSVALSQTMMPMTPGQYMRGQLARGIGEMALAIGALARQNREIEEEVVNARREFFETANTAAGPAAAKRFEEALHKRDLHYVVYDIMRDPRASPILKFTVDAAGSRDVDGGISPYCYQTFRKWSTELTSNAARLGDLQSALQASMPLFDAYRVERDLAEALFFNPGSVLRAENPHPQEYLAAWLMGTKAEKTAAAANGTASKIAAQLGRARLDEIVNVLRDWTQVSDHLDGPWRTAPRAVLEPLISGRATQPAFADWGPETRVFLEMRGHLLDPRMQLTGAVDEIQRLWESGRRSHDVATLRRATERRDRLLEEIEAASLRDLELRDGTAKLAKSMVEVNFLFIDHGIDALEIDAMNRRERNPRGPQIAQQNREYLSVNAKLIPRWVQTPPQPAGSSAPVLGESAPRPGAPATDADARGTRRGAPTHTPVAASVPGPSPAPAESSGAGPVLPAEGAPGTGPLDRAIILAQQPKAIYINPSHLSNWLSIHARKWEEANMPEAGEYRKAGMGNVVQEMRNLVRDLRQEIDNIKGTIRINGGMTNNPQGLAHNQARIAALGTVASEVEARIVDMEKAIATLK